MDKLSKQELSESFCQFIISLLSDFEEYLSKSENVNIIEDKVGFRSYPLYLSDEEFMEMMGEIHTSIRKRLENKPSSNRILRKFSTVNTPYKQDQTII
ncbi:hypothetical protein CLHOM_15910 [Clostridium homopropionicum DSM 5847]|uniref:Uncharacterized protein n=1 Tax=Clostridium homopropionicum DSM 5847 TaxID=1121318 RepID=A0A0L6ZAM3_9CLOT|nr:hypothetical protein [Clostridium homopropionicum]KOA20026.1 hypothetical protein CLHOM_15910 [Clostridium homopropionicum DSM 5847]SFG65094.1 hypothetical protein SAMN04488501_11266 [Clostridium homopropionicum]